MWNIKTKLILAFLFWFAIDKSYCQAELKFFNAKSEIIIERNGVKEDFIAHIRYNLNDTLWVSFTGTFGIEGARMLITKDSTYIINKLDKTSSVFTNEEENDIIPYSFSLDDWKILLLNIPTNQDSASEMVMENEILVHTYFSQNKIQKTYQKTNRLLKCHFNNTRNGMICEVIYNQYDNSSKVWPLAKERNIQITQASREPIKISIKYLEYSFNNVKPFQFNFTQYKNEISP